MFYYKCTQNILFLNHVLFRMNIVSSPLCSYCQMNEETIIHLFCHCNIAMQLWDSLAAAKPGIQFPALTPKSAYFGFHPLRDSLVNHIHLIFRIALYKKRDSRSCSVSYILNKISQIKNLEENFTFLDPVALQGNRFKWARFDN